jgi:hypothetical protein
VSTPPVGVTVSADAPPEAANSANGNIDFLNIMFSFFSIS